MFRRDKARVSDVNSSSREQPSTCYLFSTKTDCSGWAPSLGTVAAPCDRLQEAEPFTLGQPTTVHVSQGIRSDREPEELWTEVCDVVQEAGIKTIPKKKKCKKAKWLSEEAL